MKKLLFFVGVAVQSAVAFADVTYTGADESSPLDLSLATNWSAAPTPDDVATVSMSVASGTAFTLSGDLSVKGLSFTSVSAAFSLAGPGQLTLGASGITSSAGKNFKLTAPVTTTAAQTWDFTTSAGIFTCGAKITGTENLTWKAYSITVSEPPDYGGRLIFSTANKWDSYVQITKKGRLAASASINGQFYHNFNEAYSPKDLVDNGYLQLDGWNHPYFNAYSSSSVMNVGDGEKITHGGDAGYFIQGTYNQTGGDVTLSATLSLGRAFWGGTTTANFTFNLSDGLFQSVTTRTETTSLLVGYRNASGKASVKANQTGGTLKMRNGVYVGGAGGSSTSICEYNLGGGTFVPVRPTTDEKDAYCKIDRHGLVFACNIVPDDNATSVGIFTQTGGTSDVTRVRWGYGEESYAGTPPKSIGEGFGIFDLAGGFCSLGKYGFCVHTNTWNRDSTGAELAHADSSYRIRLRGGTLKPQTALVNKMQWEVEPSDDPNGFTLDTNGKNVDLVAPVWGSGTLRKTGTGILTIADLSRFTGTLAVDEGSAEVLGTCTDEWLDGAIRFTGDGVAAALGEGGTNGAEVASWSDESGTITAGDVHASGIYTKIPAKPKLALGAFNGHAGVKFNASGLEVPAAQNPVAGRVKWSVAVVFKDTVGGANNVDRSSYEWCYSRHLIGNTNSGEWQNNEWAIAYGGATEYANALSLGLGYNPPKDYFHCTAPRDNMNDGKVHVVFCSVDGNKSSINVDGGYATNMTVATASPAAARLVKPLYIGFAAMQKPTDNYNSEAFGGTIAEIRFYTNRVLTVGEQNGLARALRAKYANMSVFDLSHDATGVTGGAAGGFSGVGPVPALPTGANVWSADAVALDDGAAVETWTSDTAIAATKQTGAGNAAPTLVKNAMNGKAVLRFDADSRTVLGVAAADSPISGKYAATAAVVFRTTVDGTGENQSRYGRGLVSTVKGASAAEDFSISLEKEGSIYGLYGSAASSGVAAWTRKPCRLADGTPHIVILSGDQEADTLVQMTDGLACRKTGLTTPTARGDYVLHFGGSATAATNAKCFTGDIAEIVVWDRALSEAEMTAATESLAAKYKIRPLAKMPFEAADVADSGLAATNITVAAGATLRLPVSKSAPFTLTAGALSGEGRVLGSVRFAAGATCDFSAQPTIEDVQLADGSVLKLGDSILTAPLDGISSASGNVTVDVSAIAARLPKKGRWPIVVIGASAVEGATFAVVGGDDATMRVEYDAKRGCLVLRREVGLTVIIR